MMYTRYNAWSGRSQSTADVYRMSASAVSELGDDSSYPPAPYSTLSRLGSRRHHETVASSVNISRVHSYLTDDVRKQFEHGYGTSTSNDVEDAPQSNSRSKNFVKQLVVTLERQQRGQQQQQGSVIDGSKIVNHEVYKTGGVRHHERLGRDQPTIRIHASDLEDLHEHESEYISSRNDYLCHGYYEQRETSTTQENDSNTTSKSSKSTKVATARRTLKNVISTIKSWRLGPKSLPKGSRDYYAARESLGEEMRTFHRDTLPQLMKRAQIKSLGVAEQRDKKLQAPREFTKSMGSPTVVDEKKQPTTATIRSPRRGQGKLSRIPDVARGQSELLMAGEVLRGSKKIQPPSLPSSPVTPEPDLLVRSSEVHEIQKSYASNSRKIQLRRWLLPQHAASTTTLDVVYDVPQPITPITEDVIIQHRLWPSANREYANISGDDENEDKRMNCTSLTTF